MNPIEFIQKIRFDFIQPLDDFDGPADIDLEIENTRLPILQDYYRSRLWSLCQIPHLSTFAIGAIIHRLAANVPPEACFLNIGVWHGFSLFAGMLDQPDLKVIGLDNFSNKVSDTALNTLGGNPGRFFKAFWARYQQPAHRFYERDFRDYLTNVHRTPIGFYIYDADHSYEAQLDGLRLAEPFLLPGSFILVDDTNWLPVYESTLEFVKSSPYRYRVIIDQMTARNEHPTYWNGLMILQKEN